MWELVGGILLLAVVVFLFTLIYIKEVKGRRKLYLALEDRSSFNNITRGYNNLLSVDTNYNCLVKQTQKRLNVKLSECDLEIFFKTIDKYFYGDFSVANEERNINYLVSNFARNNLPQFNKELIREILGIEKNK